MSKKSIFKVVNGAKKPTITMIGYVGSYKVNSEDLRNAITEMENDNVTDCDILINSGGGSTIDGLTIGDLLTNSTIKFHGIVIGMAASMAGSILQFCNTRSAYKNARIMIHKVQGGEFGESDALRAMADLIDQEEEKIIDQFVLATGQTIEKVKAWMKPGVMKWFTAKDALKNKLIDTIIESDAKPKDAIENSVLTDELAVLNAYNPLVNEIITNNYENKKTQVKTIMNKSEIIALLVANNLQGNLTENSSDADVKALLEQVVADAKTGNQHKTKLDNYLKESGEVIINKAATEGKIPSNEKAQWLEDYIENPTMVTRAISRMAGKPNPKNGIQTPEPRNEGEDEAHKLFKGRESWSFAKWQDEAPEDLAVIEDEAPEQFETLFNKTNK